MILLQFSSIYMYKCTVHIQSWLARGQICAQLCDSHSLFLLLSHSCYFTEGKLKKRMRQYKQLLDDDNEYWLTGYLVHIMAKNIPCEMIGGLASEFRALVCSKYVASTPSFNHIMK